MRFASVAFQSAVPVDHYGYGGSGGLFHGNWNQETAIFTDIVARNLARNVRVEEGLGQAYSECGACADRNCRHFAVARQVVQLLSVGSPDRLAATAGRKLPFAAGLRKTHDVDLIASAFIRCVGQPP